MIKKVLIVDDDQEMLLSLKEGLEKYDETFSVLMAGDGLIAMEKLKRHTISLVVTDLKMPRVDGFSLLSHIMENYPYIPVVVITGYSTPEMEKMAKDGGAVGLIEKPFMLDELARQILDKLRKESEGGTLHSVSSGMFLQLIEMEQKTCTIRLMDRASGKQGILFFQNGELLDAKLNGIHGEEAAFEIFSWDEVNLSIQNDCAQTENKIQSDLQAILLEAMRLKDEASQRSETEARSSSSDEMEKEAGAHKLNQGLHSAEGIRNRLHRAIGERCGLQEVRQLDSWDGLLAQMARMGGFLEAGKLKLVYIDKGESNDFILLPGGKTFVLSVDQRCPRDRIIQVFSDR